MSDKNSSREFPLQPEDPESVLAVHLYQHPDSSSTINDLTTETDLPRGVVVESLERLHQLGYAVQVEDGAYRSHPHQERIQRYVRAVEQVIEMHATHPDNPDSPAPNPSRTPESGQISDKALESELSEIEAEISQDVGDG
jgi:hypothetical protein